MKIIPFEQFHDSGILRDIPVSCSIGVFDGVHTGHQLLITKICSFPDTASAIVTFRKNPKSILYGDRFPGDITTTGQKLKILSEYCIDYVIVIDFSAEFSQYTGEEFLLMLKESCDLRHVVVGENFHCGKGGSFSSASVREFLSSRSVDVEIIPSLLYDGKYVVSSSHIRRAVLQGELDVVEKLMNRAYSLDMANIPQYRRDEAIYIPKEHVPQPLPPPGVYGVHCILQGRLTDGIVDITIDRDYILIPVEGKIDGLVFA